MPLEQCIKIAVSTHSRLKAAEAMACRTAPAITVSTHSRLKAAEREYLVFARIYCSFNTQPPEGG